MKVRAIQKHPYYGIEREVGEEYDMDEKDVLIMTQYGNIVPLEVQRRDIQSNKPKKYQRRDMKAS
jgi:hypothetical protein